MRSTYRRFAAMAVIPVAAAGIMVAAHPAVAAAPKYLSSSCSDDGYRLGIGVHYYNDSTQHVVTKVSWHVGGNAGNTNYLAFRVYVDKNNAPDPDITNGYNLTVKKGFGEKSVSGRTSLSNKMYLGFGMQFHKANAVDPYCDGQTSRV
ncbi:hypothetical protein ACIBKY_05060 [Nonomuraea sp. NPDC050394]|uniref:hypothetical protein n=1 Tax=Nonomuraea sp. NPDC050394 TaxID=3364363 RepID=UPI0037873EA8